ncbi:cyclic nucleotide-binding domain-containing protein [Nocardioides bizhenqiangii]|uniref:Cyclic nucleotide-binding domain-containing protein n=1 Tax=Nocardioides bizhenqiangii TaxID=3095076 RepID=A0ABZ0ZNI7_9ACTN|nr:MULTISPECIES: cyclic nucleotide-binding domain-containing protein [unclassified Nocardioides]MDZ5620677.1 cyclic nucleotide-binding domain-containing protein [Nocardioides sp. HM23]WQQ25043.1 cyclic nucleotide-binding domain-containing protein [Nocardioides sp. HM61]
MGKLRSLKQQLDVLRGRYEGFRVESAADRDECMRVLDEVRRLELKRVKGRSVLESAAFVDVDVDDVLLAVRDTAEDRIVGCIRSTPAAQIATLQSSRDEYQIDKLAPDLLDRTQVLTRFAMLRSHRSTLASYVIMRELYRDSLARGLLISLQSCEPGLYATYLRLGFRPMGSVHQSSLGGFRIPMVHVHHDRDHMERVGTPLVKELPRDRPLPTEGIEWYREMEAREGRIDPGVAFHETNDGADSQGEAEVHAWLTEGLSDKGRAELLRNALEVNCTDGDVVIAAGDGGRFLGFVLDGVVEVKTGDRVVRMLGEGELFGEIALVLDRPRTVDIVAAGDDTRVLLLSQTALTRLSTGADQVQVWRNIARVLATRLPYTT